MEKVLSYRIENGATIITTARRGDFVYNKLGVPGVCYRKDQGIYVVYMEFEKRKYSIGSFGTFEEATKARKVAEHKRDQGVFVEWLKSKPHGNSVHYMEFWEREWDAIII